MDPASILILQNALQNIRLADDAVTRVLEYEAFKDAAETSAPHSTPVKDDTTKHASFGATTQYPNLNPPRASTAASSAAQPPREQIVWLQHLKQDRRVIAESTISRGFLLDNQISSHHMKRVYPAAKELEELKAFNVTLQSSRQRRTSHSCSDQKKFEDILEKYFYL